MNMKQKMFFQQKKKKKMKIYLQKLKTVLKSLKYY